MKRWIKYIIFFLACSSIFVILYKQEGKKEYNKIREYEVVVNNENSRISRIAIFNEKVLYMKKNGAEFYVYDYTTSQNKYVYSISNFMLRGRSYTFIDDKLYFYVSTNSDGEIKNELYEFDFTEDEMKLICENAYDQKLIPIATSNDKILALQGHLSENGVAEFWIESITENGEINKINLSKGLNYDRRIKYIDADQNYVYSIEESIVSDKKEYFYIKYNHEFELIEMDNITEIFEKSEISESIGTFYAFGDYFCITDISCASIICHVKNDKIDILLYDKALEYVRNSCLNNRYEYFYVRRTNNIYRLNNETGDLVLLDYELENDTSCVRYIMGDGNTLGVVKISEKTESEKIYFIEGDI